MPSEGAVDNACSKRGVPLAQATLGPIKPAQLHARSRVPHRLSDSLKILLAMDHGANVPIVRQNPSAGRECGLRSVASCCGVRSCIGGPHTFARGFGTVASASLSGYAPCWSTHPLSLSNAVPRGTLVPVHTVLRSAQRA